MNMKATYLLLHDYKDLLGYPLNDIPGVPNEGHSVYFEAVTLSGKDRSELWNQMYVALERESDKHFESIISKLFLPNQINGGITRDICMLELSYAIVPEGKQDAVEFDFPYYPIFESSIISLNDYLEYREYYTRYHEFDSYINEFLDSSINKLVEDIMSRRNILALEVKVDREFGIMDIGKQVALNTKTRVFEIVEPPTHGYTVIAYASPCKATVDFTPLNVELPPERQIHTIDDLYDFF